MIELLNIDCMEYMKTLPDKAFDLAVVDPPYGLDTRLSNGAGKLRDRNFKNLYIGKTWDKKPAPEYFIELFRVSSNQIIWGGNYHNLPPTRGIIAWDKKQPWPNFSAWEYAWTSFDTPAKLVKIDNKNMIIPKIHPTQKQVSLYSWLLQSYAKPGQRILDTHLGSGSSAIAAHYFGCEFVGCEIDVDYFNAARERFDRETRQVAMW